MNTLSSTHPDPFSATSYEFSIANASGESFGRHRMELAPPIDTGIQGKGDNRRGKSISLFRLQGISIKKGVIMPLFLSSFIYRPEVG
jgi:hypothetical protein